MDKSNLNTKKANACLTNEAYIFTISEDFNYKIKVRVKMVL